MKKRIGRRLVSLLLTFVTVLTMLPAMTLPALAATSGTVTGLDDENIGLSYKGTEDKPWTAAKKLIEGETSGSGSWFQQAYNSTLTITNKKLTKATLSFDFTIETKGGKIQVDGTPYTAAVNTPFSKELGSGDSITVQIDSGKGSGSYAKITMKNVTLVSDTTPTVTFLPAENGSYTVDEKTITEAYTNTQSSAIPYQVKATAAEGYRFRGWYNVNTNKIIDTSPETALNLDSDCTITAQFIDKDLAFFETNGQVFDDLNDAITEAKKNLSTITLAQGGKITGNYTIPSGVTLLIPFDEAKTVYTTKPGHVDSYTTPNVFRKMTMVSGSSITVNGAISVGGQHFAGQGKQGPSGPYGQIDMAAGSSIKLNSGAKLYAWGYITGDGQITATSGAAVYEYFQVTDWRGGTATKTMINNEEKVFPFSQYYVQNIEAALTIQAGATESTYISISAKYVGTKSASIDFIGSSKSLFRLGNGGTLTKKYDPKTDRVTYTTTGSASLDSLALSISGIGGITVDSSKYVLPVSNNMTLNILSGNIAVNCDAALLPGAQITIAQGAELKVSTDKSLYVYDYNTETKEWGPYCINNKEFVPVLYSPTKTGTRTLTDAKIDVNGTLTAAGSIYTTNSGANICSSEGTGKYVQQSNPGTESTTHQATQNDKSISYTNIPITAAKLKNADGADKPYTETSTAKAGNTFTYCTCPTCGGGKWTNTNDLQVAEIDENDGTLVKTYNTLKGAVDNLKAGQYIKLLHNTTEDINNITKDIYLDLNGRTVTGTFNMGSHKLYGMDSSAGTGYDVAPSGKIVGKVTGTVAPVFEKPLTGDAEYNYLRYVAIKNDAGTEYTFHRFNISVTGYRFELATGDTPQCALFFIGKFQGDEAAKGYLTSLGFTLKVKGENGENDTQLGEDNYELPDNKNEIPKMPAAGEESTSKVVYDRDGDGAYLFEVYLKRSFDKTKPGGYTEEIGATAQATFKNHGTQKSTPQYLSFEEAWKNAEISDSAQQEILDRFLEYLGIPKLTE